MPAFQIEGLTKRFGRRIAVDALSFEVRAGEIVGLLGPNGAGKSTTFLCAAGLLRPDAGSFKWNGAELGAKRGQTVALIPETPDVYPMLTVWEHLEFVAKSCRLDGGWQQRGRELLERFGMSDRLTALGAELSKGMRQKTLVAATVIASMPVLLFDEPTIGLDPLGQRELRAIMRDLAAGGTAIVLSTHMLEQARDLCDRIVIVKEGRMAAQGTLAELQAEFSGHENLEELFLELTR